MNLAALAILVLYVQAVGAIETRTVVAPDSVRIGERFVLAISVAGVTRDAELVFPALPDTGVVTALGPPLRFDDDGSPSARYELVAWAPGDLALPVGSIRVVTGGAELTIPLPGVSVHVSSVLPVGADADTLAWRPPAEVLGPNWGLGEKLAAAGIALALVIATLLYSRRRAAVLPVPVPPTQSAQARALEALDRLEASGLIEAGELKGFFSELSYVLREFLSQVDEAWGLDLTTSELMGSVCQDGVSHGHVLTLDGLLDGADLVKFARRRPSRAQAARALDAARRWFVEFERRVPEPEAEEADAGFELAALTEMDEMFAEDETGSELAGEAESSKP